MAKDNSAQVAQLFNEIRDQRDAAIAERARYGDMMTERLGKCENERDAARAEVAALRDALQSLVDGKSEFDIEYDTGMPAAEAREIINLAYNRK